MNKLSIISMTAIICTLLGSTIVKAADLDYYETKDRSYIDRTLDDFERRTGQRHSYEERYEEKHNRYDYKRDWSRECLPKRKIRRSLIKRGWHDFHIVKQRPRRIKILATNYNGRRFKLVLDSCSGAIIRRKPMRKYWGWN